MPAAQIGLRPATKDDVPFLLTLRQQTMDAHLFVSGLVPSVESRRRLVVRMTGSVGAKSLELGKNVNANSLRLVPGAFAFLDQLPKPGALF
jgi:hypothetical protein